MNNKNVILTISRLLKEQGKKQKDLTDFLGIGENRFTDWKSGRITSWSKYVPQIAEFLDVSTDYLLGLSDEEPCTASNGEVLTEQEKTLIQIFRETTEEGRLEMITAIMTIKNAIEKKNTPANTNSAG